MVCPICSACDTRSFRKVGVYEYFCCGGCDSIFLDDAVLREVDAGLSLIDYDEQYWSSELSSSTERSYGPSLARTAEAFLYAQRKIDVFLDVGAGAGFLLDALAKYLPASCSKFYGVEKFPPAIHTRRENFLIGDVAEFPKKVDAGVCVEVVEHLTPYMLSSLIGGLSSISNENALYIINSGQPKYVVHEDPGYLDPTGRGHVVSYSVKGMQSLAEPHGFVVHELPGKTWALVLEKCAVSPGSCISDRIWSPVEENRRTLCDPVMGSVMYILGLESARAYR